MRSSQTATRNNRKTNENRQAGTHVQKERCYSVPREEKRRPPTRPVFTLFGPPGHFRRLAESLAKIQEAERAQAERDWKRKDTARMEAYVQEAEELAAEEKAKFRQKGREAAAPVAGKASQNGASAASVQPVLS